MSDHDYTPEEARALDLAQDHLGNAAIELDRALGELLKVDRFKPGRRHLKPTVRDVFDMTSVAAACQKAVYEEMPDE